MSDSVQVVVDGVIFTDFKDIRIRTTIEAAASDFKLTTAHRPGLPLRAGAHVVIYYLDERQDIPPEFLGPSGSVRNPSFATASQPIERKVFQGFIDEIEPEIGRNGRVFVTSGRSESAGVVDNSAMNDPGEWRDIPFHRLVAEIGLEAGVTVIRREEQFHETPAPFSKFRLQPGESAFEAIDRAAKMRGRLVYPSIGFLEVALPSDRLMNAGKGRRPARIEEGQNIKEAKFIDSWKDRYHHYVVRGQDIGTDERHGLDVGTIEGEAFDLALAPPNNGPRSLRKRTLLTIVDKPLSQEEATERAKFEAVSRAARGARLKATLAGWKCWPDEDDSEIWAPNFLLRARIPSLRIFSAFLISGVTLLRDQKSGTTTQLDLMRRDAFIISKSTIADAVDQEEDPALAWSGADLD